MTEEVKKPAPLRLAPIITLDAKFFWDAAREEKFVCEKCSDCGEFRYPPRPMCPHCHSVKRDVTELSGKGKVFSWIRPSHPKAVGFAEQPVAAVIEVEEGFRIVSNVIDCEFGDIEAGMPVEVAFADTMQKKKVPVFRPAQ